LFVASRLLEAAILLRLAAPWTDNGNCLLWRSGAMFAFADVFRFFAHKLARLSGRRLAFALVLTRSFYCFFVWHNKRITPLERRLAVNNKTAGVIPDALLFQKNRSAAFEKRLRLKYTIGLMDGRLIGRNPIGHATTAR
jgi:hypothetical protein